MKTSQLFKRFLRFFVLIGLLGGLCLTPISSAQAQQALHWRLSLPISAYNSLETQLEDLPGRRWQQDRAAQNAILEGSGTQADLRSLLFDELAPLSLISQPTRIQIQIPAQSQQELVLEALPGNGAYWYFTGPSQILVQELGSPEYRSPGKGVPALQRFLINNPTVYEQNAVFDYKRIFDQDWQPMLYLDLGGLGKDQVLELSDPSYRALIPALFPAAPQVKAPESSRATPVLPAYYDARQYGLVTPVKNQGYCGSCWAFGTVGVMETALARSGYGLRDLSEQFLISCNQDNWGCGGGLTAHPYHFDKKDKLGQGPGAVFELDAPYLGVNSACTSLPRAFRLADWEYVAGGRDPWLEGSLPSEQLIKEAIYQYGAVTAGVCAGQVFRGYSGGVYIADECDYNRYPVTNHQIILVGWNDTNQTWLLKNSYGTFWGLQGYMWIRRGTGMVGEGASWVRMEPVLPVPLEPRGGIDAARPVFTWQPAGLASSYEVQVLDVMNGKIYSADAIQSNSIQLSEDLPLGSYRWRVRSNLSDVWTSWAEFWRVGTDPVPLCPQGSTYKVDPFQFTWLAANGGGPYTLDLPDPLPDWSSGALECPQGLCTAVISLDTLEEGDYSWRVKQGDGDYSTALEFRLLDKKDKTYLPLISNH